MKDAINQQHDTSSNATDQDDIAPGYFGFVGVLLMGLAACAKQLERYPQGARRLERLAVLGLGYVVVWAWIKYGHS